MGKLVPIKTPFKIVSVRIKAGNLEIFDGFDWLILGPVIGKQGEPGKDGEDGKRGKQGQPGEKGQDGKPGKLGTAGKRGKNGSNGSNGRDGQPGKKGETGKQGKQGRPGKNGDVGKQGNPGDPGQKGDPGQMPKHELNQEKTKIRFEISPGKWGKWIKLQISIQNIGGSSGAFRQVQFETIINEDKILTKRFVDQVVTATDRIVSITLPDASIVKNRAIFIRSHPTSTKKTKVFPFGDQLIENTDSLILKAKEGYIIFSTGTEWLIGY